ncbi:MAG TPA: D-2-hydroxyacid dehydrogenase, partial [Pseudomonas pachastrellae]|nr:D-2-hydroxyacid dehydrogenase [Halopseudomonas pachastrellae]
PPLTEDTRGLINRDRLALMRRDALLVNVGRGAIVVTDDLVDALQQRQLGAAVLDVVDPEPLPEGHALWDMPNVMLSAHMAGDFIGWRRALGEQFMANLHRWLADEPLHNRVNRGK